METFHYIWTLLEPKTEYANLINKCKELWDSFDIQKQREIYSTIRRKKIERRFVDYNPLLAIRNNANAAIHQKQVLSYAAYYERFGTTEELPGWRRVYLAEQQKTIYVKD